MKKQDPRVKRTRKNIMDSFMKLLKQKEFNDISISDITSEADINRSTFYYHFLDKYDLKDSVQREILATEVFHKLVLQEDIDEETISLSLQAIINCHSNLSFECQRSYEEFKPKLDNELREHLMEILNRILDKKYGKREKHIMLATFWSGGIYEVALSCYEGNEKIENAINQLSQIILINI